MTRPPMARPARPQRRRPPLPTLRPAAMPALLSPPQGSTHHLNKRRAVVRSSGRALLASRNLFGSRSVVNRPIYLSRARSHCRFAPLLVHFILFRPFEYKGI